MIFQNEVLLSNRKHPQAQEKQTTTCTNAFQFTYVSLLNKQWREKESAT